MADPVQKRESVSGDDALGGQRQHASADVAPELYSQRDERGDRIERHSTGANR